MEKKYKVMVSKGDKNNKVALLRHSHAMKPYSRTASIVGSMFGLVELRTDKDSMATATGE